MVNKRRPRRKATAKDINSAYNTYASRTSKLNKAAREKSAAIGARNENKYNKAASDNTRPPKADAIKNEIRRGGPHVTELTSSGPVPQGGTKKMLKGSRRRVRRSAASKAAKQSAIKQYK